MAKKTNKSSDIPSEMTPSVLGDDIQPLATLLPQMAVPKSTKKITPTRVMPPDIGVDAPSFIPPMPTPSAIEWDTKSDTPWRAQPIGGLWTTDQNGNGWLWLDKEWVRISDATETGLMAMMMIAASCKETGTPCLNRRNSEGKIEELYVL
jgi:hypothetical protein